MSITQQKLKDLLNLLQDGLSKADFEQLGKTLTELILKIEKNQDDKFTKTLELLRNEIENFLRSGETDFLTLKNSVEKRFTSAQEELRNSLNFMREKIDRVQKEPGPKGEKGDSIKGPPGPPGKDAELPELTIDNIKDLRETLDELKRRPGRVGGGFSYIAMDQHFIDDETPTNSGDDLNFTISRKPNPESSLKVYRNGQRLRVTEDYTFSGVTITLLTALSAGEILLADYRS